MIDNSSSETKKYVDSLLNVASRLELLYQLKEQGKMDESQYYLIPLLEIYLFTVLSQIEVLTYDKAARNAKSQWEINMCYCFCEIVFGESMSYFFGFDKSNNNKQKKTKELKSLITNNKVENGIIDIVSNCNSFFKKCYDANLFATIKREKNISKHYDFDYIEVITNLILANSDTNKERINQYLKWLIDVKECLEQYLTDKNVAIYVESSYTLKKRAFNVVQIPYFQDHNIILKKIELGEKWVLSNLAHSKLLSDRINFACCNELRKDFSAVILFNQWKKATELFTASLHIQYVELSVLYAIKSYSECSDAMERQINLYRILLAYYEGYNKLFGINAKNEQMSMINLLGQFVTPLNDELIQKQYIDIKATLQSQLKKVKQYEKARNIITHNNDKGKDRILEKLYSLISIDPTVLLTDVGHFLETNLPIMKLTDILAQSYLPEYWQHVSH